MASPYAPTVASKQFKGLAETRHKMMVEGMHQVQQTYTDGNPMRKIRR